ncbi:hypothetical protein [Campylobacter corcagiensis]|uniref:Uncharacterized protein n=1 Tax=Campylobacter corcagiensis TaxID=1448857 RepID=A0A7M1LFJ6_9BACT|nr:hypothetical protein [Campylobacter corcagiensis]QKF64515.1 hypothetical protein CCORG_0649 [Campylobacter corcagiensis]QOQ87308.1 hypothetical protein IMC76_00315 [Campylobacter corcagiensis]
MKELKLIDLVRLSRELETLYFVAKHTKGERKQILLGIYYRLYDLVSKLQSSKVLKYEELLS